MKATEGVWAIARYGTGDGPRRASAVLGTLATADFLVDDYKQLLSQVQITRL